MSAALESGAVDTAWLTQRLRTASVIRDARVTSVESKAVGVGMLGDSIRFAVTYDMDEGAPESFVGKFASADPVSRKTGADFGLYAREIGFYRHLADTVAIRTPACFSAEIDEADGTFALLLEDLTPARGGNQLTGCDLPDAEAAMVQAAALHGPRWNDATLRDHAFLDTSAARDFVVQVFPDCLAEFHTRYDGVLEPEYMAVCDAYGALIGQAMNHPPTSFTLTHGDFRLDNMLFDASDRAVPLAVLDWQSPAIGLGAVDIAYFLGLALSVDNRRRHERHLLDFYLDQLRGYGVTGYDYDALCRDYRLTLLSGVSTAVFASASTKRTERGDAMFLAMARGGAAQAIDADALGALRVI
ncbi:ecdysteroid 22-kinase family protein [Sphingomonas sp. SUN019]|uniref:ecdysteroid 22-kinase family protein n=1 Tax=Sphingomonas sp. SUN019 TaxID=2937788 RepID=UPI002164E1F3|nr:ecdysteroid 22-kinase family protein [Sphingomonas sp. SUN019]UVO51733.1 ecdysteroid 22-kinase family protein [Sphingomonas sp. SUN019]